MSRRTSHGGSVQSSTMAVDRIIAGERKYREGIAKNFTQSKLAAENYFARNGDVEKALLAAVEGDENQKQAILNTIQEQRDRLKKVSEKNVENTRKVNAFIGALEQVKTLVVQQDTTPENQEPVNYEELITKQMKDYQTEAASTQLDYKDEKYCRDIIQALGEHVAGNDDEDEDLQVVGGNSARSLKCPVTAMYMEEPMKSKVCGHSYSKQGIMQLLRGKHHIDCPVAGCNNQSLTKDQLEFDMETEHKVKRHMRNEARAREHQATQDLMSDDEQEM